MASSFLLRLAFCDFFVNLILIVVSLVVTTRLVSCLDRVISKMTCYVSDGTLNFAHLFKISDDDTLQSCLIFY